MSKALEEVRISFYWVRRDPPGLIVNDCNVVPCSTFRRDRKRTSNIGVNEIKYPNRAALRSLWNSGAWHLTHDATFTCI
eukprot:IDg5993t1